MDVVLLHEGLHERLLDHPEVGSHELKDLRGPLAGYEERRLGVLVCLRRALVHCPLGAGIFGFSKAGISIAIQPAVESGGILTLVAA